MFTERVVLCPALPRARARSQLAQGSPAEDLHEDLLAGVFLVGSGDAHAGQKPTRHRIVGPVQLAPGLSVAGYAAIKELSHATNFARL